MDTNNETVTEATVIRLAEQMDLQTEEFGRIKQAASVASPVEMKILHDSLVRRMRNKSYQGKRPETFDTL